MDILPSRLACHLFGKRNLYENFEAYDIKEMAAFGDSLFILSYSKSPYRMNDDEMPNEDGYLSYGETLQVLSTKTGERSFVETRIVLARTAITFPSSSFFPSLAKTHG